MSEVARRTTAPFLRLSLLLHVAALGALALRPGAWPWIAGSILADHLIAVAAGLTPRSRLLGPNLSRLPAPAGRRVGLTFDDGPDPEVTPCVLALLRERGLRASFFVVGERAARHPDLVRAAAAAGHRVENHTWSHSNAFSLFGPRRTAVEVDRAQRLLGDLAGRAPHLVRAPAGLRNPFLEPVLRRRGLHLASWSRRGWDTVDGDPERVLRRLTRRIEPGEVLLLHDGDPARTVERRPVVLEVLPRLLDELDHLGLRPGPIVGSAGRPTPPGAAD